MPINANDLTFPAGSPLPAASIEPVTRRRASRSGSEPTEFSPPGLGLRPVEPSIAKQLEEHFFTYQNDPKYRKSFDEFFTDFRQNELNAIYAAEEAGPPSRRVPRVRSSELKNCARQTHYRLSKVEPQAIGRGEWQLAAQIGTATHSIILASLDFMGLVDAIEYDVEVEGGYFGGRVDARLKGEPRTILDIKTVAPADFEKGCWGEKVSGYVSQVSAYALLDNCSRGIVLLVDRGKGRMADFEWDIDTRKGEELLKRAKKISEGVANGVIPNREGYERGKKSFACFNFCAFSRQCDQDDEDLFW